MRCLTCHYDLRNLSEGTVHRCPECGRAFDPNDSRTFDWGLWHTWPKLSHALWIVIGSVALSVLITWFNRSAFIRPPVNLLRLAPFAAVLSMMICGLLLLPYAVVSTVLILRNKRQKNWHP